MPRFRTLLLLFVVPAIILSLASCAKQETVHRKVIGVTLLTRAHVFYKNLEEGLQTEAAKDSFDLVVTAGEMDLGKQASQIEDFIAQKVDAIIVCPVDSRGIGPAIKKANDAGIPVFTADIAAKEGKIVSHVASDNLAGGRLAGEYLAKILKGKGTVAVIDEPTITSVLDRVQGFKEAIAKFPDMKIVADVNGDGVRDKAMSVAADILQSHPDLDGIFGINDDTALGALDAAVQFKRMNLSIIGYDATPPAADAIKKDTPLKADVIQYPKLIGTTTINAIHDYLAGKTVPALIPVAVGIADKAALTASN
jgi:ribose transport system substrate-binding protein